MITHRLSDETDVGHSLAKKTQLKQHQSWFVLPCFNQGRRPRGFGRLGVWLRDIANLVLLWPQTQFVRLTGFDNHPLMHIATNSLRVSAPTAKFAANQLAFGEPCVTAIPDLTKHELEHWIVPFRFIRIVEFGLLRAVFLDVSLHAVRAEQGLELNNASMRTLQSEPDSRLRFAALSRFEGLMIFKRILLAGKSKSIAKHQLVVFAILWLALVTGGSAQQLATPTVNAPARGDSLLIIGNGSHSVEPVRTALADAPEVSPNPGGTICGTVTDGNDDIVPDANVILEGNGSAHRQTATSSEEGFFQFTNVEAGDSYRVRVHADGFADWSSEVLRLESGQVLILNNVALRLEGGPVSVTVTASTPEQLAIEQVHIAEQQRVFGFIPNFFVVYDRNPVPLTSKLKFKLALRVAVDPVTFFGVAAMAGIDQAANTPNYVEGVKGYGQRAGALYTDAFTDTMLAGAILPSLLHQDPRYFYQGTGTTRSRLRHALLSPFVCMGDNGKWQPNYSSVAGNLGTTALSQLYYPRSNRGYSLVFGNFFIGTGERMVSGIAQEFILRRLTPGAAKNQ